MARKVLLSFVLQTFHCLQSRLYWQRVINADVSRTNIIESLHIDVVNAISNLTIAHLPSSSIAPCYLPSAGRIFEKNNKNCRIFQRPALKKISYTLFSDCLQVALKYCSNIIRYARTMQHVTATKPSWCGTKMPWNLWLKFLCQQNFAKFGGGRSGRTDASVTSEERPDNYEFGRFVYTGALDMFTNPKKSTCIRSGKRFAEKCAELVTASGERLRWVDRCCYLGVYFTSDAALGVALMMPNPDSLGRSTPFSV